MKLSIVVEAREDFELILPLIRKMDRFQKEGKYLFYRMVCICQNHEEQEFKSCLKKYRLNVPYSFWKKNEEGIVSQDSKLPHFFSEDLFRHPPEMVLLLRYSDISSICAQKANELLIPVGILDNPESEVSWEEPHDYIFPVGIKNCWDLIIHEIIKRFKL